MANVYVEARPKGRSEGSHIADYVVEEEGDRVLETFKTQAEAITWAKRCLSFPPAQSAAKMAGQSAVSVCSWQTCRWQT
jgi:hypothetical protein